MNKIINKFLLTGNKFIPELLLKQPGFTYGACGSFSKHYERIKKFRETNNLKHLYRSELGKHILLMMQHILMKLIAEKFMKT